MIELISIKTKGNKMNTKMKLAGIMLGAALTTTSAFAGNGSCGAGKCGGEAKTEKMDKKGSCGAGKCGGDMKKSEKMDKKGSCGAGKCGGDMKKKAEKKAGSCGAGKCGSK